MRNYCRRLLKWHISISQLEVFERSKQPRGNIRRLQHRKLLSPAIPRATSERYKSFPALPSCFFLEPPLGAKVRPIVPVDSCLPVRRAGAPRHTGASPPSCPPPRGSAALQAEGLEDGGAVWQAGEVCLGEHPIAHDQSKLGLDPLDDARVPCEAVEEIGKKGGGGVEGGEENVLELSLDLA
jgi:hypothetical protein